MPPVFVHGIGLRTPLGNEPRALLGALCEGRTGFAPYAPFREAGLRVPIAASVPAESLAASQLCAQDDRGARLLEAAIRDALLDAGGTSDLSALGAIPESRVALVTGTSSSGIGPFCDSLRTGIARPHDDTRYGSATALIARGLGFGGPVLTVCSVCASGALAIAEAADLLRAGVADVAIAVGYDPLEPFVAAGFEALGTIAEQPRPFRAGRRGFLLGEGAAALVLSSKPDTLPSCRGVVLGWGSSSDAHHLTAPHPDGEGLVLAVRRALRSAGMTIDDIGAINAHGTGTVYNDAMEAKAVGRLFGERATSVPLYTIKGALGHTLGAAGAIEAAVSMLAMDAGVIPPTVTEGEQDPACAVDLVVGVARRVATRRTLSLSAGFGGANCALVLAPHAGASR